MCRLNSSSNILALCFPASPRPHPLLSPSPCCPSLLLLLLSPLAGSRGSGPTSSHHWLWTHLCGTASRAYTALLRPCFPFCLLILRTSPNLSHLFYWFFFLNKLTSPAFWCWTVFYSHVTLKSSTIRFLFLKKKRFVFRIPVPTLLASENDVNTPLYLCGPESLRHSVWCWAVCVPPLSAALLRSLSTAAAEPVAACALDGVPSLGCFDFIDCQDC